MGGEKTERLLIEYKEIQKQLKAKPLNIREGLDRLKEEMEP